MTTPILMLPVRRKRDVLIARQRTRQVAALLGYEPPEQVLLAAAVFELARQVRRARRARLRVEAVRGILRISGGPGLRLERPLPPKALGMTLEDTAWAVQQLDELDPLDVFDEMCRLNGELLEALRANERQPARSAA